MITLTTPASVPGELGAASANSYGKMRVMNILADPVAQTIQATVQLLDANNTNLPAIDGTLSIQTVGNSPIVTLQVPGMDVQSVVALTSAQQTTVQGWITQLQTSIESGLISLAIIAGAQTAGV